MCAERLSVTPLAVARCRREASTHGGPKPACARHGSGRRRARAPRERGQALLETLVGAIVLVPLVLLAIWLGKVQSVRQATIAASRTLAFECTARPDACASADGQAVLADEIRRRAFSRIDTGVLTADRLPDDAPAAERNPLWVDRANRPLLERFGDIGVRVDREHFDAGASLAESRAGGLVADVAGFLADHAGPGRFGLDITEGLIDAKVQANVSASRSATDFSSQLDTIPLRVKAHTAVLTDAWNASGPYGPDARSVESRVDKGKQILPIYESTVDARYLPTRGFIALMNAIGLEPTGDAFRYHRADVDVVPPDRLGGSGDVPQYGGSAPIDPGQGGGW